MKEHFAVIEIPTGSSNKYEMDHDSGRIVLDRALYTALGYPADYGFIEGTLGLDGDPLDVLVLLERPVLPGIGIRVRAVGVFNMTDEAGPDSKIIAVPFGDRRWENITDIADVPAPLRDKIEHFFAHYKELEPGKWVNVQGWGNVEEADRRLTEAYERNGLG
ncbi:inorganic diphosphatase [Arthrobacter cryoconiti]|uniref:Inorganic pyrophosphatase n=1 Tax=Arthrobacter cryoconiti TaxID=748907 RepID=A0ABV8R1D3_9MICC|nr:inorganic diphosphatase [Arthrobacter cryoconiti]MCC9069944.1 inorganic diphosphatase [Arthrobacter cryoconiti]